MLQSIFIIVVAFLLFIGGALAILALRLSNVVNQYNERLDDVLEAGVYSINSKAQQQEAYDGFDVGECKFFVNSFAAIMGENEVTQDLVDKLTNLAGDGMLYCYMDDGRVLYSSTAEEPEFTQNFISMLRVKRDIRINRQLYTARAFDGGWLMIKWEPFPELRLKGDVFDQKMDGVALTLYSEDAKEIVNSTEQELLGLSFEEYLGQDSVSDVLLKLNENEEEYAGFGSNPYTGLIYYKICRVDASKQLIAHLDLNIIAMGVLRSLIIQITIMLVTFAVMIRHAIFLGRNLRDEGGKRVAGKLCISTQNVSHITALMVFGMMVMLSLTTYLQLLTAYSEENRRAVTNLKAMAERVEANEQNRKDILDYFIGAYQDSADMIAGALRDIPGLLNGESMTRFAKMANVDSVDVFDGEGYMVATSGIDAGYQLSIDPDTLEYGCRQLLDGGATSISIDLGDGSYYIAVRRKDEPGLVRLKVKTIYLDNLLVHLSTEEAVLSSNTDGAHKIYVNLAEPGNMYVQEDGATAIFALPNSLSEIVMQGQKTGVETIAGINYYINEYINDKYLYITTTPVKNIRKNAFSGIVTEGVVCFLLYVLLVLVCCFYLGEPTDRNMEPKNVRKRNVMERLVDNSFRKAIQIMLAIDCVILALLLGLDAYFSNNSLLVYLLSSQWPRGLNMFSVTMILLAMIFSQIISVVLQKVILLIAKNLGSRGATFGRLLCSLIRFGALAWAVLFSLVQLGANLNQVLAGAGFTGVVIGYAGQGIINDLLSGFFIVFEGHFHVGDWVTVNGWRGQVQEIGVRTTCISNSGDVKVFNNSSLNEIIAWSHTMSGALVEVSVDYHEDIDKVIALLESSVERYRKEIPYLVEGPGVHGVTDLGDNGVTIRMWALVENGVLAKKAERQVRQLTKKIFDENGICIPFPQVVLHDGDRRPVQVVRPVRRMRVVKKKSAEKGSSPAVTPQPPSQNQK